MSKLVIAFVCFFSQTSSVSKHVLVEFSQILAYIFPTFFEMDEEIAERPPHIRHVPIQEEEIFDGSMRSRTPPPVTQFPKHDMRNFTNIEKLSGENFPVWKFQMCILLRAQKMLGILYGSTPRDSFADEEDWFDKDGACQSFLISATDNKLMHRLMHCRIANQTS